MTRLSRKLVTFGLVLGFLSPSYAFAAPPSAPTNVTAVNASTANTATNAAQVQVSWSTVTGAIGYYVTATADGVSTSKAVPGALTNSVVFEGLTGGKSYNFTVIARNNLGEDSVASAAATAVAQSVPFAMTATGTEIASGTSVKLTWRALSSSDNGGLAITGYTITEKGGKVPPVNVANIAALEQIVSGLQSGVTYDFSITATNALGTSACAPVGDRKSVV
jgi:titin